MELIKIINNYLTGNNSLFDFNIDKHLSYLNKFPEPLSLIERSYYQYKCQCFQNKSLIVIRNNVFAFFALLPVIFYLILKSRHKNVDLKKDEDYKNSAVFIFGGTENIVPLSLTRNYSNYTIADFGKFWFLNSTDLRYLHRLFPYALSPFFVLKCLYKVAMYRGIIDYYHPKSIICSSEFSYTSSLLTAYCEQNQIKHINVMHGEKLLNIRDSFFKFHECYVWDQHYVSIFKTLRAYEEQFIVDIPPCLILKNNSKRPPKYKITYYLAGEEKKELINIKEILLKINVSNEKICIRPHPIYSKINLVQKIFKDFTIENFKDCTIQESFNNTECIVSLYSTVLYQGFLSSKNIIIDNLSQVEKFKKLDKLKFIVLNKPHHLISELIY